MDLAQHEQGRALRVVPDSGAAEIIIFDRGLSLPMVMMPTSDTYDLAAAGGARIVHAMRIRELRVGSHKLRDQLAVVVARPEPDAPDADGLLPLHLFERVAFWGRQRVLLVWPR